MRAIPSPAGAAGSSTPPPGEIDLESNPALLTRCDRCGRSEDDEP